ncbi:hypothetical protein N7462_001097 [Penicillium macrosclerotiorum]|uniref:uncharacterized protein n=1 Tax=Penicillium macrosclerotiorum TaxID=303699 RepID=UPI002549AB20|nr:uncharacterized protein N7462_001097 [Penicillium macrosclerotiorum]KAJ5699092.1 hypothetical protein N7462_001097 [Penicillium macrosclerotiorum]
MTTMNDRMELVPGTQDVFGQLPRMKGYTHLVVCLSHPESYSRDATVLAFQAAASRITAALPWLGGAVLHSEVGPGCTGIFTVARCARTRNILHIQDRSEECSSYEDIIASRAPSDLLEGHLLSAQTSLPDSYTESETEPAPVLTLTMSWIKNGLILDCAAQHNILDMGGIDQFFRLLATELQAKCCGHTVIDTNNRDRLQMFSLLEPNEFRCGHSDMRCPSSLITIRRSPPPGSLPAFYHFRFDKASILQLAGLANTPSVDDALSAFIWKQLSIARLRLGQKPGTVTGFSRAVDCRQALNIPKEYMGVAVVKTFSTMTLEEIGRASLGSIAVNLRRDVRRIRDRSFLRSLATLIAEEPDKSTINYVPELNPDTWLNASSWAGVGAYSLNFGPLGKPGIVRRPKSKPVLGLLYFLPKSEQGDIDVLLCLKESEIQGLRGDPQWSQYAGYIG